MAPVRKSLQKVHSFRRRWLIRRELDSAILEDREAGFDASFYAMAASQIFRSPEQALYHYRTIGGRLGVRPREDFDLITYRRSNPDVLHAGYEPFAHFFQFGRYEGRIELPQDGDADDERQPRPDISQLLALRPSRSTSPRVDVVVPVYGNRKLTLRTLESVLRATVRLPYELFVIDDASPDPLLRTELRALAAAGLFKLLENHRNLGFVATANRGMALHEDRDVVLLNSDTYVYDGWLDRLVTALYWREDIGTASPISNAATILSYPISLRDNHRIPEINFTHIDQLCARLASHPIDLPTALGFCMAIRRSCLTSIGPFDEKGFGRGYGEENDFSLRAIAQGWRTVAAPSVFVWHRGGASFGAERAALVDAAQRTLEKLHPGYAASIQHFICRDPLSSVREILDIARVRSDPRPKILVLGRRSVATKLDKVSLVAVPDTSPYLGGYRICGMNIGPTPNIARLGWNATIVDWSTLIQKLKVEEILIDSGMASFNFGHHPAATAAKDLAIPISRI